MTEPTPQSPAQRSFWRLTGQSKTTRGRMVVDLQVDDDLEYQLWQASPIELAQPIRVAVMQSPRLDDVPWCGSAAPVVSDRLRILLQQWDPNAAQFLPTRLEGAPEGTGAYWIVNCLRVAECHDVERSTFSDLGDGERMLRMWTLDPSRVPADVHLFRVKYLQALALISGEVRREMEDQKMTGCKFFEAEGRLW